MSMTYMFVPLRPEDQHEGLYTTEELSDELARYGIALPDLDDEESTSYSMLLPNTQGELNLEEEVFFNVADGKVLGMSIERPNPDARRFWFILIQLGFAMVEAGDGDVFLNAEIAAAFDQAGGKIQGFDQYHVIRAINDFARYKL